MIYLFCPSKSYNDDLILSFHFEKKDKPSVIEALKKYYSSYLQEDSNTLDESSVEIILSENKVIFKEKDDDHYHSLYIREVPNIKDL